MTKEAVVKEPPQDLDASSDKGNKKKDGFFKFMQDQFIHPSRIFQAAAEKALNRKKGKKRNRIEANNANVNTSTDIDTEISVQLQNVRISEEISNSVDCNGNSDEREIHDEIIELFPGGNQDAVRNVLDAISPYCESQDLLYRNLRKAGQREIGVAQQEYGSTLGTFRDIDGIIVMSKTLDFYNFEQKKYQLMTKVKLRDVTSMLKKCRKMVFASDTSDDDGARQPIQQLIWAARLFNECPVRVFYYTIPSDEELLQMEEQGGRFSNRQPTNGCHEVVKQIFAETVRELGVEFRDNRRRLIEESRVNQDFLETSTMMCRTLEASGIVVDCNPNNFMAHESMDIYGEDMSFISRKFQEIFERQMLLRGAARFAVRFGVLEMGTRIHPGKVDGEWKFRRPSDLLERIILHKIGRSGFVSIHFAATLVSKEQVHLFPKRESMKHPDAPAYIDEHGGTRKCQKFPIFGRSDLANVHCSLHEQAEYKENLHIPQKRGYVKIEYSTETCQVYSNASHMFPSRTNPQGTRISEDKQAERLLPKYYKGGGGGNRCPFTDFIVTRYLLNMLGGKELTRMQLLTPIREVIRFVGALSNKSIGIRAESVVNARFHGIWDPEEEWDEDATCTLLDFANCEQASGIPERTLINMIQQGEVAKVEVLAWERYIMGILAPLLCSLLRCVIDHREDSINLSAVKLSRVCEAVVNFLFVGNTNYCGDNKILSMAGCTQKDGLGDMIGELAIIDFQRPLEEQLAKLYLTWRPVPFRGGSIRDYKNLFFLCFPATIHRSINRNEIYVQYDRASHHAIFMLQKFINQAPLMEPKLVVKLMVLCCFPLMWNIKREAYRASGFQAMEPDDLAKLLTSVPVESPVTTLEHIWQLWNGTCYPIRQARIIVNSFLNYRQAEPMTIVLLREALHEMDINRFYIYNFGRYDDQFDNIRDQRRVLSILGSDVMRTMMQHGFDIVPMSVLDAFWQYLQQELRFRYNVFDYAMVLMPTVYEDGDFALELRKWLSQVLKPLWEYGNHLQNPNQATSSYFVRRMEQENWSIQVITDAVLAVLIRQVQQNVWGVSPVTTNNSGLGYVDFTQMRLTEGFAPNLNTVKVRNTFEAAEAMGLLFCLPGRDLEYYRQDENRWWSSSKVFRVLRNEESTTREGRELRRSRNFFKRNAQNPNSFARRVRVGGPILTTYTSEEKRKITMFGDELQKAREEMAEKFRAEACIIISNAMCFHGDIRGYLLELLSTQDPEARKIATTVLQTCVFNLSNFLLKYMTTKSLTEQDSTEMLLQIGTELYAQLSNATIAKWVDELHCKKPFPLFFDDFIHAVQIYLLNRQEQLALTMQRQTATRSVRSVQPPTETALRMQSNFSQSQTDRATSPPPAAELENFEAVDAAQPDAPGAVVDPTIEIVHHRRQTSRRRATGRPLPIQRNARVQSVVQQPAQSAAISMDQIYLPYQMRLRSQGPTLDNADRPPPIRSRKRSAERTIQAEVGGSCGAQQPAHGSIVEDQGSIADDQEQHAGPSRPLDDLMQLFTETESNPTQQRLTPEEIRKRAVAWCNNMIFAINNGSVPGQIPTICKQLAYHMNGRQLPKNRWEGELLKACEKLLTFDSNYSPLMNASFAPNARLYASNRGPSHSRFANDLLNRRSQQQSNQFNNAAASNAGARFPSREHGRISIELTPISLHNWYINEVSLIGEYFLGNLINAWEKMERENVSRRSIYVGEILKRVGNAPRILEQEQLYINYLWFQLKNFYNQNKEIIDRLKATMASMEMDTLSVERNLEVASDYRNFINPAQSTVYIPIATAANGSCWLHAVAIALFGHIEKMVQNEQEINNTFDSNEQDILHDETNLLESALFSFSWGDHLSLQLLSMALHRQIVVYANDFAPNNGQGFIVVAMRRSLLVPTLDHSISNWFQQ